MKEANKKSAEAGVAVAPIRIVVADDHPVVRFGVKNMLENESGFEVVGEAEDGDVAITQTLELEPDILLLDLLMPRLPGLEAMRAIMGKSPRVKIILLTSTISTQQIIEALQIGEGPARCAFRRLLDWRRAGREPGHQAQRVDEGSRRGSGTQDLWSDATGARGSHLHC
jgi:chemotaxis response regulator CheB